MSIFFILLSMSIFDDDISRLNLEDYIWIVFAILAFLNIFGDNLLKEFIKTKNKNFENRANKIFLFTLIVSFIIYIYFFYRNYIFFKKASNEDKFLLLIKLIGSSLLIGGTLCIIYFQIKQSDFIGTPAI